MDETVDKGGPKGRGTEGTPPDPPLLKSQGKEGYASGQEEGELVIGDEMRNIKNSKNDSRVSPCGASASSTQLRKGSRSVEK